MTNWKTKTASGIDSKAQSIQRSIDLAVEQVTENIELFHAAKKLTDEIMVTENIALIHSLKDLTGEIIEASIVHSESIKSYILNPSNRCCSDWRRMWKNIRQRQR